MSESVAGSKRKREGSETDLLQDKHAVPVPSERAVFSLLRSALEKVKEGNHTPELVTRIAMLLIDLKKQSRQEFVEVLKATEQTEKAKQRVDATHLQLQNLLYEKEHLLREIHKCRQFKSKHDEIDIVSEEDLLLEAPASLVEGLDQGVTDEETKKHRLMLARLSWEQSRRQAMAEEAKKLKERKEEMAKENTQLAAKIWDLPAKLKTVLAACKDVMEFVGEGEGHTVLDNVPSAHLPAPLHILFAELTGLRTLSFPTLRVAVKGEIDTAPSQDDDADMPEGAAVEKKKEDVDRKAQEAEKELLEAHPVSVVVTIPCNEDVHVSLEVSFRARLGIATVVTKVLDERNLIASDALILQDLLGEDAGTDCPNRTAAMHLEKMSLGSFESLVPELGHAYKWLQSICGLDAGHITERPSLKRVITEVQQRVCGQHALAREVKGLAEGKIAVHDYAQSTFTVPQAAKLATWTRKDVPGSAAVFSFTLERGGSVLGGTVTVPAQYPDQAPVFALSMQKSKAGQEESDARNVAAMEREVNAHSRDLEALPRSHLLTHMVRRVQQQLDLYVESLAHGGAAFALGPALPRVAQDVE